MDNQSVVVFFGIGFFIMMVGLLVGIGFLIYVSIELRKTLSGIRELIHITQDRLMPVIQETEMTLRSIRKVSDDVGTVTENVKNFSTAMEDVVKNVRAISSIAEEFRSGVSLRVSGVKAGLKAAINVLLKQIKERRTSQ